MVEAAGVEISRDVNETERLLHDQELGVPVDPTSSVVIGWLWAERGQSAPTSELLALALQAASDQIGVEAHEPAARTFVQLRPEPVDPFR